MEIDNTRANVCRECPWKYYEMFEAEGTGIEPKPQVDSGYSALEFGERMHQLWEEHFKEVADIPYTPFPGHPNAILETEAQVLISAYKAHYPVENFGIVDVERSFRIAIPGTRHIYTGKLDLTFRLDNVLDIMDHKSQELSSKSNLPQKWAARDQASLYLWAARHIYQEPIGHFWVDVAIRPSPKGQRGPQFPDRQKLERTEIQIQQALRDLVWIADQIELMREKFGNNPWPATREMCYTWGYCPYYLPHTYGWSEEIREHKYQPRREYLELAGVPIIQP